MAFMVLQDDDIFGGVQLRPESAETLRCELFTAEAYQHEFPAEVRVQSNVADEALGYLSLRCIDCHAAAVLVVDCHYIVHIGIFRQQIPANAGDGIVHNADDALHGCVDTENVACAAGPLSPGVRIAHPGFDRRLGQLCHDIGGELHFVQIRRRSHDEICLIDPTAAGHILTHGAEYNAIAYNLATFGNIAQGNLVGLGNVRLGHSSVRKRCSLLKVAYSDGDIVALVDFDRECFHLRSS